MIKKLQKLKRKKGFSMIEAVVVIAVIGILMLVIISNIDNVGSRIKAANSAASNFYVAVQSTFTRYMTYPGWLSPALEEESNPMIMYYPAANGNYPRPASDAIVCTDDKYPSPCDLYIELYANNGDVKFVNVDYTLTGLLAQSESTTNEFARVLKQEIEKRIDYQNGYYYAHIKCKPTYDMMTPTKPTSMDTVYVEYTAFAYRRLEAAYTGFSGRDYQLLNGEPCGVCAPVSKNYTGMKVGFAGTNLSQAA